MIKNLYEVILVYCKSFTVMMVSSHTCILVFKFAQNVKIDLSLSQSKILAEICFAIRVIMQFHQITFFVYLIFRSYVPVGIFSMRNNA